jgi:hypothetical protein
LGVALLGRRFSAGLWSLYDHNPTQKVLSVSVAPSGWFLGRFSVPCDRKPAEIRVTSVAG